MPSGTFRTTDKLFIILFVSGGKTSARIRRCVRKASIKQVPFGTLQSESTWQVLQPSPGALLSRHAVVGGCLSSFSISDIIWSMLKLKISNNVNDNNLNSSRISPPVSTYPTLPEKIFFICFAFFAIPNVVDERLKTST